MWKQTIYYPFQYIAAYAHGKVLHTPIDIPLYSGKAQLKAAMLDTLAVWNETASEIALFVVNRSDNEEAELQLELSGFECRSILQSVSLSAKDKKQTNQENHNAVVPHETDQVTLRDNLLTSKFEPLSFNMIRIAV